MIYRAQFEVIDQGKPLSELGTEGRQRITADILQLGMVIEGPISEPKLIDLEGQPWIQLEAEVRDAGQLLESVGVKA
ncbi:hypothetical protein [Arthrobacter sp. 18067]|uniref:hypothetical protein n=1 Tax=Arthrobacter sp. 18067 TaxID=2681413 RepID=UPI00135981A9|nr:hypothetical protein [Arthrobacter sp. 18067]